MASRAPTAPRPGTVDLWLGPVAPLAAVAESRTDWLSADERARAEAMLTPSARRPFVVGRVALRALLARACRCPPGSLVFAHGPEGRPALADAGGPGFNVSHTADVLGVAVADGGRPGLDVEPAAGPDDAEALARRFFSAAEAAALAARPDGDRRRAFAAAWTVKEAVVKALGAGIGFGLDRVEVAMGEGAPARLVALDGDTGAAERWSLFTFDAPAAHVGALAVEGRGWRLARHRLDADVLGPP